MKSATRKSSGRGKAGSDELTNMADPTATAVVPMFALAPRIEQAEVADLSEEDYAAQLLTAAESLVSAVTDTPGSKSTVAKELVADNVMDETMVEQMLTNASAAADVAAPSAITATDSPPAGAVILPAQCLIRDAVELKQQLLQRIHDANVVAIDGSLVERIDTAALQVLLAFVRDREQQQRAVSWAGCNEVLLESALILGLHGMLHLPAEKVAA